MLRLLSDEDFRRAIVRGLLRKQPELDLVRVQDVDLRGKIDELILEWAAQENRVLLSHDRNTMTAFVKDRLAAGLPVCGLIVVSQDMKTGKAIDDILLAAHLGNPAEWKDRTLYVPI